MGNHSKLDGSVELFVVNRYQIAEVTDGEYYAKQFAGQYKTFEKNEAFVFTPDEFRKFSEATSFGEAKRTKSGTPNISWVWIKKMIVLPARVTRHFLPDEGQTKSIVRVSTKAVDESENIEKFKRVVENTLLRGIKRDIYLDVPHNRRVNYKKEGDFQIYVWGIPEDNVDYRQPQVPDKIFGIRVDMGGEGLVARKESIIQKYARDFKFMEIMDGTYVVATLFPNAVFIAHDCVHYASDNELEIFALIMQKVASLAMSPEAWEKYRLELEKQRIEAEKNAFKNLLISSVKARSNRDKKVLDAAKKRAIELGDLYFAAEREVFALQVAATDPEISQAKFLAEFEKLQSGKVPGVLGITFDPANPDNLVFHFDEVVVPHPRKRNIGHHLGKCDATVSLQQGTLQIKNVTYGVKVEKNVGHNFHSPHVFDENGQNVCLGNIREEMRAYIAHYELEAAATLIFAFLHSVTDDGNSGHGYIARLEHYPEVRLDDATKKKVA